MRTILTLLAITIGTTLSSQSFRFNMYSSIDQPINLLTFPFTDIQGVTVIDHQMANTLGIRADAILNDWLDLGFSFGYSQRYFSGQAYCVLCFFVIPPPVESFSYSYAATGLIATVRPFEGRLTPYFLTGPGFLIPINNHGEETSLGVMQLMEDGPIPNWQTGIGLSVNFSNWAIGMEGVYQLTVGRTFGFNNSEAISRAAFRERMKFVQYRLVISRSF